MINKDLYNLNTIIIYLNDYFNTLCYMAVGYQIHIIMSLLFILLSDVTMQGID
jgi:hypothetical protein